MRLVAPLTLLCLLAVTLLTYISPSEAQETQALSSHNTVCSRFRPCKIIRCHPDYRLVFRSYRAGYGRCRDCGRCVPRIQPCPFIKCGPINRDCPKVLRGPILRFQGKPCRGCPRCVSMCPNLQCLVPPRPDCPRVIQGPLIRQKGKQVCTGCPECAERCEDIPCRLIACARPIPGNLVRRPGKPTCVGCDICGTVCPFLTCPELADTCRVERGPILNTGIGQKPCFGCDKCACPFPICPLVFCPNPGPAPLRIIPGIPFPCFGCPTCPGLQLPSTH